MNGEFLQIDKYRVKYWVRRMLAKGGKFISAANALGVSASQITRWASDDYEDVPNYSQCHELARWSREYGLIVESCRELGLFEAVVQIYTQHLMSQAVWSGAYAADASAMLAAAKIDLSAELEKAGLVEAEDE